MDWDDALDIIALSLASHAQSLRSILDDVGAVLPKTVTNLLESAEVAAHDGSLEVSLDGTLDAPIQAKKDAQRMYDLLKEATEQLRASLTNLGILPD
ncbi:MAG: hypothetical protein ABI824_04755 [Acidobacteriota bacterium]